MPKSNYWFGSDPVTIPLDYTWTYYPRDLARTFRTDDNYLVSKFLLTPEQQKLLNMMNRKDKWATEPKFKIGLIVSSFVLVNIPPTVNYPRFGASRNMLSVGFEITPGCPWIRSSAVSQETIGRYRYCLCSAVVWSCRGLIPTLQRER